MFNKLKNITPNKKAALALTARIVLPLVAIAVTDAVVKKVSNKDN